MYILARLAPGVKYYFTAYPLKLPHSPQLLSPGKNPRLPCAKRKAKAPILIDNDLPMFPR
uniref:Uncharacterized protein n=1 Tax=Salmonella phage vB_SEnST11_KE22 TaxID=3161173 RepID=A0AAU8GFK7_9CAUD